VLGLGSEPLYEHASAGGHRHHRSTSRVTACCNRMAPMCIRTPSNQLRRSVERARMRNSEHRQLRFERVLRRSYKSLLSVPGRF
jgi:hypothetical protein